MSFPTRCEVLKSQIRGRALDRSLPQLPAALAQQIPGAGKSLLIAGYGRTSTHDEAQPAVLRVGVIEAAAPASCHLVSENFDATWLFCGAAATTDPTAPGGTPTATIRPVSVPLGHAGVVSLRIDDDKSRRARVEIGFFTRGGRLLSRAFRSVSTNRWVRFKLPRQMQRFSGYVCAQGTDGTRKSSNMACASDIIR